MIKQLESIKIKRSQIKLAGYNPRKITAENKKKLEKNMEQYGLMGGLVWNETTGNLVSGHQRISILDKQNKYKKGDKKTDYDVLVTKVNLTLEQEKEQNIFFNNALAQGIFDDAKLEKLMKEIKFSEKTGFSKKEQISYLHDTELTEDEYRKICEQVAETTQSIQQMHTDRVKEVDANYVVLVFKNRGDKQTLIDNLGIQLDNGRFCNAHDFLEQLYEEYQKGLG